MYNLKNRRLNISTSRLANHDFKRRKYHPPQCALSSPLVLHVRQQYLYFSIMPSIVFNNYKCENFISLK